MFAFLQPQFSFAEGNSDNQNTGPEPKVYSKSEFVDSGVKSLVTGVVFGNLMTLGFGAITVGLNLGAQKLGYIPAGQLSSYEAFPIGIVVGGVTTCVVALTFLNRTNK